MRVSDFSIMKAYMIKNQGSSCIPSQHQTWAYLNDANTWILESTNDFYSGQAVVAGSSAVLERHYFRLDETQSSGGSYYLKKYATTDAPE